MKTNYTSGPWRFEKGRDNTIADLSNTDAFVFGTILSRNDFHIARVWADVGADSDPEANAQLIASAPELLDALRGALFFVPLETEARKRADAAIAKAEGK